MIACRLPRSLSVGCRGYCLSGFHLSSPLNPLHLQFNSNFLVPVSNPIFFRRLSSCFSGGTGAQPVLPRLDQRIFQATEQKPRTIIVSILGGNNCKLCAKAAFWVRRILLSLPNARSTLIFSEVLGEKQRFNQVPTPPVSASLECTDTAQSSGCTAEAGRRSTFVDEAASAQVMFTGGTGGVARPSALETAGSLQDSCGAKEECALHGSAARCRNVVSVKLQQFNLDCLDTRKQLDLSKDEAQTLRENIPLVCVNGRQVSRLRFNGPAVRSALLEELDRLTSPQ